MLDEYPKMFMVGVDNVGSKQMMQIRQSLRGKAEILMGKNTMIRKAIRGHLENNPSLERYEFVLHVCLLSFGIVLWDLSSYGFKSWDFMNLQMLLYFVRIVLTKECEKDFVVLFDPRLLPHIKGNVGFVFTKEDLVSVRDDILANKVAAPARAGAIAPVDVFVPKGNTGLGPEKTSFFQALAIPTKISKAMIEILVRSS